MLIGWLKKFWCKTRASIDETAFLLINTKSELVGRGKMIVLFLYNSHVCMSVTFYIVICQWFDIFF